MATRKGRSKPAAPKAQIQSAFVSLDTIANAVAAKLSAREQNPNTLGELAQQLTIRSEKLGPTAPAPPPESSFDHAQLNFAKAAELCNRLFVLEERLHGNPEKNGPGSSPDSSGLNEVLSRTGDLLSASHDSLSRLCSYLGIEV